MLGHKSQVGKDTLGDQLVQRDNFERLAFADKLKQTVQELYNFSSEQMYDPIAKNTPDVRYPNTIDKPSDDGYTKHFTPRRILQIFGQQQRLLYPNIWASFVFNKIQEIHNNTGKENFIITDFRFPNELVVAKAWEQQNFYKRKVFSVKIQRTDLSKNFSGVEDISETALDDFSNWSFTLTNYGLDQTDSIRKLYDDFHIAKTQLLQKTTQIPNTGPF